MPDIVTLTINPAVDIFVNVERVEPTRKLRCSAPKRDPGGGGINVARVAHRLGGNVAAIYPIGGAIGKLLQRLVEREGIDSVVTPSHVETRENFTAYEEHSGQQYRFVLPGSALASRRMGGLSRQTGDAASEAEIRGGERQHSARRAGRFLRRASRATPSAWAPRRCSTPRAPRSAPRSRKASP